MPRNNRRHQNVNTATGTNPHRRLPGETSPETTQQQPPPSKPNPKFLSLLLQALIMALIISLFFIFVGVAAIIFLHLCIAGGALHRRHRRNQRRPISEDGEIPSGYSLELLKTLPKSKFKGCSEICAICLENVKDEDFCRVLPSCKHVFHLTCVDRWLLKVPACPVCRSSVSLLNDHQEVNRSGVIDWEQLWAACG